MLALIFIEIWIKLLEYNYDARCVAYRTAAKEMFKQIPTRMIKPLIPRKKAQKIITEIDGGWYMERIDKVLPPLKIPKPIKKSQ